MNLRLLLFCLTCFISATAFAQQNVSITGTVLNNDTKEPIEQVTVQLLSRTDSASIKGMFTDKEGKFSMTAPTGSYLLKFSLIGYADVFKTVRTTNNRNLGSIYMDEADIVLDSAMIVAHVAEMVIKGDTIEYNADSYKTLPSAVVEDLIKKLPGAEIDSEGKITINGKEIKKILVDKKEFFSDDPKVASKNLPANMVDKLQVWDKKSDMAEMTGFDDGQEETVINLTVKKGMKRGLFGNASAGIGNKDKYEANVMANYMHENSQFTLIGGANNTNNSGFSDFASSAFSGNRPSRSLSFGGNNGILKSINGGFNFATEYSDKLKWGGNIQYGNTDNEVISNSYSQNYISSGDQYETRNSSGNNTGDNVSGSLRFEWSPSENTKLIFTPSVRYNKNTNDQLSDYITTLENPNDSINWGESYYRSKGDGLNLNAGLEMSHKFGKKGRILSLSLSGGLSDQESNGLNESNTYYRDARTSDILRDQIFDNNTNSYNWRAFVSYVEPIGTNNFLQLTYSFRNSFSESDRKTYNNNGFGDYNLVDTASTKKLENDFANHEIRANFQVVREKYNYTIGLAVQPSNSESKTFAPDTSYTVSNNVVNFAPIMQFIYRWDRYTTLRLNYNGSVNQPSTTQLSSVRDESNPLNITYGNPDLNPSFRNNLRVQFQKSNFEKGSSLILSSNMGFTTNAIVNYSRVDSVGKRETTYENVNGNWNANLSLMMNRRLKNPKFSVNSSTSIGYTEDNGFVNGDKNTSRDLNLSENLGGSYRSDLFDFGLSANVRYNSTNNTIQTQNQSDLSTFNYGGRANATIYLPWDFSIESDIRYSANSGYSDGYKQNEWLWNASLSKQLFKNKSGTLKFRMYDILQQRSNINRSSSAQSMRYTATNTVGSFFMVTFAYRFQIFKKGTEQSDFRRGGFRGGERPEGMERREGFQGGRPEGMGRRSF